MWLIYALGGGWGHLTRAIAFARIAQRNRPVRVVTNSPYAEIVRSELPNLDMVALDARWPAAQTRAAVLREIVECRPACLIVDTFPRGIGGELAELLNSLPSLKVLVHRDLNPRYVHTAHLRQFVATHYDLVLVPGHDAEPQVGGPPSTIVTGPWLVRSTGEIPDRARARELLRLEREEQCVLICASGKDQELAWYGAVAARLVDRAIPVRCVAAERPSQCPADCLVRYWPAMDLFGGVAVVVGSAGYNTVEESLAWNIPLIARPWPRKYDRQELRAMRAAARGRVIVVQEPEEAAQRAIEQFSQAPAGRPHFINGAEEAVACVQRSLTA